MSSIIFYLWLADVSASLGGFCFFLLIVGALIGIICGILFLVSLDERADEDTIALRSATWRVAVNLAVPLFLSGLVFGALMPSRDTMVMIAGLKAAETVVASDRGQHILDQIEALLDAQVESLTPTTETK